MNYFTLAKTQLDIVEVAKDYDFRLNRKNMARCPWHPDKTPSLHFKRDKQNYNCYGCGEHGDVFDLVGAVTNQQPLDVLRELNHSYKLGLDLEKPVSQKEIQLLKQKRRQRENFNAWEQASSLILTAYFRTLREWKETFKPQHPDTPMDPRYVEALHNLDYIEYVLDTVYITGDRDAKAKFMTSHEDMVRRIEQRLIWEGVPYAGRNGTGHKPASQFRSIVVGSTAASTAA